MQPKGSTFSVEQRLKKPEDFKRVRSKGKRKETKYYLIFVFENSLKVSRLGLAVSVRAGNAVQRNKIKRLLREFFRLNKEKFLPPKDILIIAKNGAGLKGPGSLKEVAGELTPALFALSKKP